MSKGDMEGQEITVGTLQLEIYELRQEIGMFKMRLKSLESETSALDHRTIGMVPIGGRLT